MQQYRPKSYTAHFNSHTARAAPILSSCTDTQQNIAIACKAATRRYNQFCPLDSKLYWRALQSGIQGILAAIQATL